MGIISNIREEAKGNRTKIQTADANKLEKIFNNMFFLDKNIELETEFVKRVMTRGFETQERVGLHASSLITGEKEFCIRAQVLSLMYKQLQGEQIQPGLKRIFEEGNSVHEKWQRLFIRAEYSNPDLLDVTQFNKKYRISFTPDAICTIAEFYDGQMVGEIKSVNTYQFQKMERHPSAYKQLQWYMFLTEIHKGFVLCEDKNNQDFKIEVYDYDSKIVAPFIERAEAVKFYYKRVHQEGKMVSRPKDCNEPNCKRCDKCAMHDACWNIGMGRIKLIG